MAFGTSREEFRRAERRFVRRSERRAVSAESHRAAEGIETTPRPDPLAAVPNLLSLSLVAAVAEAVLKGLLDIEEVNE